MILKNTYITTVNDQFLGWLEIDDNGLIRQIHRGECHEKNAIDLKQQYLLPGFIDSHSHGGYGYSFNELDPVKDLNLFHKYQEEIVKEGVVALVPTTVTCSQNDLLRLSDKFYNLINNHDSDLKVLAWYIEGPFISVAKKGAHEADLIQPLNDDFLIALTKKFKSKQIIITVAPENHNLDLINKYKDKFIFSIGHSDDRKLSKDLIKTNAVKRITHLFNAMTTFDHRNDSIANALFDINNFQKDFSIEIITDQIHVKPELVRLSFKHFPIDNICIISDALPDKGLANGDYFLNNLAIVKKDYVFYLKDGSSLAGSAQPFDKIVQDFCVMCNPTWNQLVHATSYNAAKNLGVSDNYGIIKEGIQAHLVVLDENKKVLKTIIKNQIVFDSLA